MDSIDSLKIYAGNNDVPIMFDETSDFICRYIKEHNVKSVLEIGTAIGFSAITFANCSPDIVVTTVEIDLDRFIQARQNVHDFNLENRIHLNHCDGLFFETQEKFDLIFIDAAKAQYTKFFERFKNNLNEGGVILSDNLYFHGMVKNQSLTHNYSTIKLVRKIKKNIGFLKSNPEFITTFYDCGDGISVSKKNPCYKKLVFEKISPGESEKIIELSKLATAIVREHFDSIIGKAQNDYMLKKFQSVEAVTQQLEYGYNYYFVKDENKVLGFLAFYRKQDEMYLSKFYLEKSCRSSGYSKNMLRFVIEETRKLNLHSIVLNVNKDNFAVQVYEKLGFEIIRSEKKSIGQGFYMDDYVMEFRL